MIRLPRWAAVTVGRALGPLIFLLVLVAPISGLHGESKRVAAAVLWMAVWWVTEAAPLAITAMLPLVLFPMLAVRGVSARWRPTTRTR